MFEAIKSLSVKQRLFAFLFTVIISSMVSVLTVYLKTDDCKNISDQYKSLIQNQEELMEINGNLLTKYNQARTDLLTIQSYVETVNDIQKQSKTQSTSKVSFEQTNHIMIDSVMVYQPTIEPSPIRTRERVTVIEEVPSEMKIAMDSILKITKQYK
jgi:hypothetical protein